MSLSQSAISLVLQQIRALLRTTIGELYANAAKAQDNQPIIALRFGGPGADLAHLLKQEPGSGDPFIFSLDSNAKDITVAHLGRDFVREGMSSLTAAAGHAGWVENELQELCFKRRKPGAVQNICAIGIAGAVKSTCPPPPRGYGANIVLRYLGKDRKAIESRYITLKLSADLSRDDHEALVTIAACNLLLVHLGYPQVPLVGSFGLSCEQLVWKEGVGYEFRPAALEAAITEDDLRQDEAWLLTPSNRLVPLTREHVDTSLYTFVSIAGRPLSRLHRHLGETAVQYPQRTADGYVYRQPAYVLTAAHPTKEPLPFAEFKRVISQLVGIAPVIILRDRGTFAAQNELYQERFGKVPEQVIGGDKLKQLFDPSFYPGNDVIAALASLVRNGTVFHVVERGSDTLEAGLAHCPSGFECLFKLLRIRLQEIGDWASSTAIRTA